MIHPRSVALRSDKITRSGVRPMLALKRAGLTCRERFCTYESPVQSVCNDPDALVTVPSLERMVHPRKIDTSLGQMLVGECW